MLKPYFYSRDILSVLRSLPEQTWDKEEAEHIFTLLGDLAGSWAWVEFYRGLMTSNDQSGMLSCEGSVGGQN